MRSTAEVLAIFHHRKDRKPKTHNDAHQGNDITYPSFPDMQRPNPPFLLDRALKGLEPLVFRFAKPPIRRPVDGYLRKGIPKYLNVVAATAARVRGKCQK